MAEPAPQSLQSALTPELVSWLCCPVDRGALIDEGRLVCVSCGAQYPVHYGIPHLIAPQPIDDDATRHRAREQAARDHDALRYDSSMASRETVIEFDAILEALNPRRGDLVVDVGAGTGRLTVALAATGARVLAIDLSPRSLDLNRAKCIEAGVADRVCHVVADACHLPIRTMVADRLASAQLLEHIWPDDERRTCADEMHRVLRQGGRLAISVYNYSRTQRRRGVSRDGRHDGDLYYHRFDRPELAGLLAGFRRSNVSAVLNLPARFATPALDRLVRAIPPLAAESGYLLFAVATKGA